MTEKSQNRPEKKSPAKEATTIKEKPKICFSSTDEGSIPVFPASEKPQTPEKPASATGKKEIPPRGKDILNKQLDNPKGVIVDNPIISKKVVENLDWWGVPQHLRAEPKKEEK